MDLLFQCNHRLVSSGLDESLVLQQTLVQITGRVDANSVMRRLPCGRRHEMIH